jgi:N-acetylglucosaminyl-diphospho-decaprenol L-rhamnosyltransferase
LRCFETGQYCNGLVAVLISVVIVNWNSGSYLEKCIRSLIRNAPGCEIIVVDNASKDSSLEFAVGENLPIKILHNSRNLGFAAANNRGWRSSQGDFVLFLNPDIECLPGAVNCLIETLSGNSAIWAVGGLLIDSSGKTQSGFNVRSFPTAGSVAAEMLFLDEIWPDNPWTSRYRMSGWNPNIASDVDQPAAACLMLTRNALEILNGFDETFYPAWFEDVDLCRRIHNAGGHIRLQPGAAFVHAGGSSLRSLDLLAYLQYFHTNMIRYFIKHHGKEYARRIRTLVIMGMRLRAILSLLYPIAKNASRISSARSFWKCSRYIASMQKVLS